LGTAPLGPRGDEGHIGDEHCRRIGLVENRVDDRRLAENILGIAVDRKIAQRLIDGRICADGAARFLLRLAPEIVRVGVSACQERKTVYGMGTTGTSEGGGLGPGT
jgi:hypothetical protein